MKAPDPIASASELLGELAVKGELPGVAVWQKSLPWPTYVELSAVADIKYWDRMGEVKPYEAALVLFDICPLEKRASPDSLETDNDISIDCRKLLRAFNDEARDGKSRSLAQWFEVAISRQLPTDWRIGAYLAARRVAGNEGRPEDGGDGLTQEHVAVPTVPKATLAAAFDGVRRTTEQWKKYLSDKPPKWLEPARMSVGARGGDSHMWCPVKFALALIGRGLVTRTQVSRIFRDREELSAWREAWAANMSAMRELGFGD